VTCFYHASTRGQSICKYCDAYLCLVGECGGGNAAPFYQDANGGPLDVDCTDCGDSVCWQCMENDHKAFFCDQCDEQLCSDCENKPGADYTFCYGCMGSWCSGCAPTSLTCTGSEGKSGSEANRDGCFATFCDGCLQKDGVLASYTFCDGQGLTLVPFSAQRKRFLW